jgi:hypothetical protein
MVTMDADKSCTATFAIEWTLTVVKAGTGSGTVTSDPAGVTCGGTCSALYSHGTEVTLSADADTGSIFTGWGGDCTSDGMVTMDADRSCTANFDVVILEPGSIAGTVKDATTAEPVPNATVRVFFSGDEVGSAMTDMSGNYTLNDLDPGFYSVTASASGYLDNTVQNVQVLSGQTTNQDIVLSPVLQIGEFRIVLTWGATPEDLDSHLILPDYHILFCDGGNQDLSVFPHAFLDVDDISGFGPETITIGSFLSGTYTYAVYNWTNESPLTSSSAVVQVFDENGLVKTYNVPTSGSGRWWHVFDIEGDTLAITDVENLGDLFPPDFERGDCF